MTRQALSATVDGVSTNLYAYDVFGNMTNEVQNGVTISRDYDAFGRPTGYALGSGGAGGSPAEPDATVAYSYDALGRFASVSAGGSGDVPSIFASLSPRFYDAFIEETNPSNIPVVKPFNNSEPNLTIGAKFGLEWTMATFHDQKCWEVEVDAR